MYTYIYIYNSDHIYRTYAYILYYIYMYVLLGYKKCNYGLF